MTINILLYGDSSPTTSLRTNISIKHQCIFNAEICWCQNTSGENKTYVSKVLLQVCFLCQQGYKHVLLWRGSPSSICTCSSLTQISQKLPHPLSANFIWSYILWHFQTISFAYFQPFWNFFLNTWPYDDINFTTLLLQFPTDTNTLTRELKNQFDRTTVGQSWS